jgi:hypothetical protein
MILRINCDYLANSISLLIFLLVIGYVLFEVQTEFLDIIYTSFADCFLCGQKSSQNIYEVSFSVVSDMKHCYGKSFSGLVPA